MDDTTSMIEFPIVDTHGGAPMNPISLSSLPNFHGITTEDPDAFLFEFDVLCQSYDYTTNLQKMKLFMATLKGESLRWFMGLGGGTITSLDDMKKTFAGFSSI
jgi:hypothetical protein